MQLSQQARLNESQVEEISYNASAKRHRPTRAQTREQEMNTRIALGPMLSSMKLATQQAAMKGFQIAKTPRGAELVNGRAQYQLISRSMQTMLELPPLVSGSEWALMFEQAILASIILNKNFSTYPMVISPDQDPDDFAESVARYDDKTTEEYIEVKWSHQPAYVAHYQGERANASVQTSH